jgi:AhpD family alkylhydroperoxidase
MVQSLVRHSKWRLSMGYGREIQNVVQPMLDDFYAEVPEVRRAYKGLQSAVLHEGDISLLTKELIALSISVVKACDMCIVGHAQKVAELGATPRQIAEALAVTVQMHGGPGAVYSARAFAAYREHRDVEGPEVPSPMHEHTH